MEYTILIYRDESRADEFDQPDVRAEYGDYTKALVDAGVLRGGERLQPSSSTTTLTYRNGERLMTDGPFAEAREQLGGFYIIECADLDEALTWAGRCPGVRHGAVELRPVAPM
jgi:hypothetical protein